MRVVEKPLLAFTIVAFTFFFLHWSGGALMVQLALFTLAFFYMFAGSIMMGGLSFREGVKAPWWWLGILAVSGLSISIFLVGGMFRILRWEGGYIMVSFGTVLLAAMSLGALILRFSWKPKSESISTSSEHILDHQMTSTRKSISYKPYFPRALVGLAVGLIFLLTSQTFWVYHLLYNQPEYRDALIEYMKDPDNPQKQEQLQQYENHVFEE